MNELQGIARIKIHHGKLEEFKRLADKCKESVRTKDTGTLQYELCFSSDYTMSSLSLNMRIMTQTGL